MTFFLVALAWALPSFLLHNVIHEGSHAVFALASGATNVKLWPFPGWRLGYFAWAHFTYDGIHSTATVGAPVLTETVWFACAALAFGLVPFGWWSAFLAVECVAALVDMTVWFLGFWRPTENMNSDAAKIRAGWRFPRGLGKVVSLAWMLPLYGAAVFLALRYAQNA